MTMTYHMEGEFQQRGEKNKHKFTIEGEGNGNPYE